MQRATRGLYGFVLMTIREITLMECRQAFIICPIGILEREHHFGVRISARLPKRLLPLSYGSAAHLSHSGPKCQAANKNCRTRTDNGRPQSRC
ncbi:hypothetical protein [Streptomyces violaceusniger]|uniref:hypothetical protein n=1 Tax=Streptomyces violaceusniger TaxID=68280 RepID=UPI003692D377